MLKEKVIILTGAAGAIGSATARMLVENHASVMLCDLNGSRLEAIQRDLRSRGGLVRSLLGM